MRPSLVVPGTVAEIAPGANVIRAGMVTSNE